MNTNPIILIVGTTRKESIHIEKYLMDWKYEAVPLDEEASGIAAPIPKSPILMLVYAQEEQKDTINYLRTASKRP
jgi:hypothetical protein